MHTLTLLVSGHFASTSLAPFISGLTTTVQSTGFQIAAQTAWSVLKVTIYAMGVYSAFEHIRAGQFDFATPALLLESVKQSFRSSGALLKLSTKVLSQRRVPAEEREAKDDEKEH